MERKFENTSLSPIDRRKLATSVFVSYRRADSSDVTGRIFDVLTSKFSKNLLFKDVDSIPLGADFRSVISEAVGQCKVLLAVIGPDWLDIKDEQGNRRLDHPEDYVRLEIAAALHRQIPVIPVLVEQASMPPADRLPQDLQELSYRNGIPIRRDPDFHNDMDRLCGELNLYVQPNQPLVFRKFVAPLTIFLFCVLLTAAFIPRFFPPKPQPKENPNAEAGTKQGPTQAPSSDDDVLVESFQIHLYSEAGGRPVFIGDLGESGPTPKIGDNVSIEVKFKHPVYALLIAFNTDGTVQLCNPDDESIVPKRTTHLSFPSVSSKGFYFTEGTGQQAFGLIVSLDPLPSFSSWKVSQGNDIPWKNFDGTAFVKIESAEDIRAKSHKLNRGQIKQRAGTEVEELDYFLREKNRVKSVVTIGFPILQGQ